jgi:hypothetical protein
MDNSFGLGVLHGFFYAVTPSLPWFMALKNYIFTGPTRGALVYAGVLIGQFIFLAMGFFGWKELLWLWYYVEPIFHAVGWAAVVHTGWKIWGVDDCNLMPKNFRFSGTSTLILARFPARREAVSLLGAGALWVFCGPKTLGLNMLGFFPTMPSVYLFGLLVGMGGVFGVFYTCCVQPMRMPNSMSDKVSLLPLKRFISPVFTVTIGAYFLSTIVAADESYLIFHYDTVAGLTPFEQLKYVYSRDMVWQTDSSVVVKQKVVKVEVEDEGVLKTTTDEEDRYRESHMKPEGYIWDYDKGQLKAVTDAQMRAEEKEAKKAKAEEEKKAKAEEEKRTKTLYEDEAWDDDDDDDDDEDEEENGDEATNGNGAAARDGAKNEKAFPTEDGAAEEEGQIAKPEDQDVVEEEEEEPKFFQSNYEYNVGSGEGRKLDPARKRIPWNADIGYKKFQDRIERKPLQKVEDFERLFTETNPWVTQRIVKTRLNTLRLFLLPQWEGKNQDHYAPDLASELAEMRLEMDFYLQDKGNVVHQRMMFPDHLAQETDLLFSQPNPDNEPTPATIRRLETYRLQGGDITQRTYNQLHQTNGGLEENMSSVKLRSTPKEIRFPWDFPRVEKAGPVVSMSETLNEMVEQNDVGAMEEVNAGMDAHFIRFLDPVALNTRLRMNDPDAFIMEPDIDSPEKYNLRVRDAFRRLWIWKLTHQEEPGWEDSDGNLLSPITVGEFWPVKKLATGAGSK